METYSKNVLIFFCLVIVFTLAGFYNSYIRFLPDFNRFPIIIHLHFFAFLCWFALLIIQPVLIKKNKIEMHRRIGKLSYFLVPVLIITIALLIAQQVQRQLTTSKQDAAFTAMVGLLDILSFSIFYTIAMVNKKNIRWHVGFLLAATLIILNPGLSRLLNQIQPGLGLIVAALLPFVISISIIILEKIKYKRAILHSPYFLFLCIWSLEIILLVNISTKVFWINMVADLFSSK